MSRLPRFDRTLLLAGGCLVPAAQREEWLRSWHAELWHLRNRSGYASNRRGPVSELAFGLLLDAFWLRAEDWRRVLRGTATLCLLSLTALCCVSALLALALYAGPSALALRSDEELPRFLFAALLVTFVALAVAPTRPIDRAHGRSGRRPKRQVFFAAKTGLVLLLTYLLSLDCCARLAAHLPLTAQVVQMLLFVVLSLVGLRWAIGDQEQRCKLCLQSLAAPARVGRPSHNLLEWNGTERSCTRGHGRLSVPELETSWCQAAEWKQHTLSGRQVSEATRHRNR